MMDKRDAPVVVKRSKKRDKGLESNSSWKVAFGDFNLSMMSVFLALWILSMSPLETRREIGRYFSDPGGIFDRTGSSHPVDMGRSLSVGSSAIDPEDFFVEAEETSPLWGLFESLRDAGLTEILEAFKGNLELHYLPEGVRIIIEESDGRSMFQRGGQLLTPYFEDLMLNLAPFLANSGRAISIVGHSDSTVFSSQAQNDNWDLSSYRANEARRVLVYGGFPERRIMQVSSMADQLPLDPDNPHSSRNRRVEIIVMTEESEQLIEGLLGGNRERMEMRNNLAEARRHAADNAMPQG